MYNKLKLIVEKLTDIGKTISTMESCTGGGVVNAITNIEGASEVIKYSAVTYSNEFKIKMGVDKEVIDKYTVYSIEVARLMSEVISNYTQSDYGIGVTGKLNRVDKYNPYGCDNIVYISIYDRNSKKHYDMNITVTEDSREKNKDLIIDKISDNLLEIIVNNRKLDSVKMFWNS